MGDELNRQKLWVALSKAFVDNEVDYVNIAELVMGYSLEEVEFAFFERVAPICGFNMLTPVPPIWTGFNEAWLVAEIEQLIKKGSQQGMWGRMSSFLKGLVLRLVCRCIWVEIKTAIKKGGG